MHILIIDDNPGITENISLYLEGKGYSADRASDGQIAFDMIQRKKYDFLIVDRMMPGIDGRSLIRMLQARNITIPFLFLTALGKQIDKIEGLSLGADDYLVKPFDLEELVLRIENIMKRNSGTHQVKKSHFSYENIMVDLEAHKVLLGERRIDLSPKEYDLLEILIRNQWKVLDRDFLYEKVWGDYDASDKVLETINVHIAHIRKKLHPDIIRTVKLVWYTIDL